MASATVGTLRAVLEADVSEFSAAMNQASTDASNLGKAIERDLEPRQRAINAAAKDFLGSNEIRRAGEYADAIEHIGGVAKLTEADQQRVNKVVSEALDHYRLLGKDAPAAMVQLEQATRGVSLPVNDLNTSLGTVWEGLKGAAGLFGIAFSATAVVGFAKGVFDAAANIHDMSEALGFSAEAFQRNTFAAEQSGGTVEAFSKAAQKLNDNLSAGSESTVAALKAAGLQFAAIRDMRPEDAWLAVTDAVGKIPDPILRAQAAQDLFGKGALTLLPGMIEGYGKLGEAADVMADKTINRLETLGDRWDQFWSKINVLGGEAIGAMFKNSEDINDAIKETALRTGQTFDTLREQVNRMSLQEQQAFLQTSQSAELDKQRHEELDKIYSTFYPKATALTKEQTDAAKKEAAAQEELNKKFQAAVDILAGKDLPGKVAALTREVIAAGKDGGVTEYQLGLLGKQLENLVKQGAVLPPVLDAIYVRQTAMDLATKTTAFSVYTLTEQLKLHNIVMKGDTLPNLDKYYRTFDEILPRLEKMGFVIKTMPSPPPTMWTGFEQDAFRAFGDIEKGMADHVVALIGHASHWRSESAAIWHGIESDVLSVFSDILQRYEKEFVAKLIGSLTGVNLGTPSMGLPGLGGLIGGGGGAGVGGVGTIINGTADANAGAAAGGGIGGAIGAVAGPIAAAVIIGEIVNHFMPIDALWRGNGPNDGTTPYGDAADAANAAYDAQARADNPGAFPQYMASGGIVNSPTLAMIGESGPEAVVPLGQSGIGTTLIVERDGREEARWLVPYFTREVQRLRLA